MICPHCGKEVKDGAKFCGSCGVMLIEPKENKFVKGLLAILKTLACIFIMLFSQGIVVVGYEYSLMAGEASNLVALAGKVSQSAEGLEQYEQYVLSKAAKIEEQIYSHMSLIGLIGGLITILVLCLILRLRKHNPAESLGIKFATPGKIALFFILGAALNVLISAVISILPLPAELINEYQEMMSRYVSSDTIFVQIISLAVITPLVEEMVYRGYAMTRMVPALGKIPAVIISALLFGFSHYALNTASFISVAYATVLGIIFAIAFLKYDSIVPTIACHMAFNLVSVLKITDETVSTVLAVASVPVTILCIYALFFARPTLTDVLIFPERYEPRNEREKRLVERIKELKHRDGPVDTSEVDSLQEEWDDINKKIEEEKKKTSEKDDDKKDEESK